MPLQPESLAFYFATSQQMPFPKSSRNFIALCVSTGSRCCPAFSTFKVGTFVKEPENSVSPCLPKRRAENGAPWCFAKMAVKTVYLPEPAADGDRLHISGDEHHHLTVARAEVGETVEVF